MTKHITISHVNIRQSIAFMLMRLVTIEVLTDILILILCFRIVTLTQIPFPTTTSFQTIVFLFLAAGKIYLTLYVVLEWLNEYYEIWPDVIIHRKGILYRTEEKYTLDHITSIGIDQGLFAKLLNYGNFVLYDRYKRKYEYLNFIHNPKRYYEILKELIPGVDEEKHTIRETIYDSD